MSQENVEIIRRAWEAWENGDIEALSAFADPGIVWELHGGALELQRPYHGQDGVRQMFREWLESFDPDTYKAQAETFIDGGDKVVVGWRATARGKASGAEVEMYRWHVYSFSNGRVIRVDVFETKPEALEATGAAADS